VTLSALSPELVSRESSPPRGKDPPSIQVGSISACASESVSDSITCASAIPSAMQ
jgi:hypothetical protein